MNKKRLQEIKDVEYRNPVIQELIEAVEERDQELERLTNELENARYVPRNRFVD